MLAPQHADAAAQRQAGQAGAGDDAAWRRQPVRQGGGVEVAPGGAAAGPGAPRGGIDAHAAHAAQVDHQPALADAVAGHVVAAAAHRDRQAVGGGPLQGATHVIRRLADRDQRGPAIDHAVEDAPALVVAGVAGPDQSHAAAVAARERTTRRGTSTPSTAISMPPPMEGQKAVVTWCVASTSVPAATGLAKESR